MCPGLRKTTVALGMGIIGLGTAYAVHFVTAEIAFLHSKLISPDQAHTAVNAGSWAQTDLALNVSAGLSPDAVRDALRTQIPSPAGIGTFASQ
jgi:hypothetical protein